MSMIHFMHNHWSIHYPPYLPLRTTGLPECTVRAVNEAVGLALIAGDRQVADYLVPVHHNRATSHGLLPSPAGSKEARKREGGREGAREGGRRDGGREGGREGWREQAW